MGGRVRTRASSPGSWNGSTAGGLQPDELGGQVADGAQPGEAFLVDTDAVGFLDDRDDGHEVDRLGAEILNKPVVQADLIHAELTGDQFPHVVRVPFHWVALGSAKPRRAASNPSRTSSAVSSLSSESTYSRLNHSAPRATPAPH